MNKTQCFLSDKKHVAAFCVFKFLLIRLMCGACFVNEVLYYHMYYHILNFVLNIFYIVIKPGMEIFHIRFLLKGSIRVMSGRNEKIIYN